MVNYEPVSAKVKIYGADVMRQTGIGSQQVSSDLEQEFCQQPEIVFFTKAKAGNGGTFFICPNSCSYFFKSMRKSEVEAARKILDEYGEHVNQNQKSFLIRFVAVFHLIIDSQATSYYMIMNNVVSKEMRLNQNAKLYDLKCSNCGRYTEGRNVTDASKLTSKIGTFYSIWMPGFLFSSEEQRQVFIETVSKDALFLLAQRVKDYSLLPVNDVENGVGPAGIIEIFTTFNGKKIVECGVMSALQGDVSGKVPRYNSERFLELFT